MAGHAWQTVAEVMLRMQLDLDREWSLDDAAAVAGYEPFHFAHVFKDIAGVSPVRYVRQLRLERAADDLAHATSKSVLQIALAAGYASSEAFSRAFRRASGQSPKQFRREAAARSTPWGERPAPRAIVDPADFPPGLSPQPTIAELGPLAAWTVRVASYEPEHVAGGMSALLEHAMPDGPWQLGGVAQPWGWIDGPAQIRDLRIARFVDDSRGPDFAPPILPWRLPRSWYVSFSYRGEMHPIADAFEWIMSTWIPRSGLRSAFLPTISQVEQLLPGPVHAKLHAPLRRLAAWP